MKTPYQLISVIIRAIVLLAIPGTAYPQSPGQVVVSQIVWMGTTTCSNDESIELYNNPVLPVNLTGWTLTTADGTPNISLSGRIPASSYYLL